MTLACIVEGYGEVDAVPALIHRICKDCGIAAPVVAKPIRYDRGQLTRDDEFMRMVGLALINAGPQGAVLLLADADDDCPAQFGPALLRRILQRADPARTSVNLACREYESWFLAAAESFRGFRKLPADLAPPEDAEAVRGAKEWLRKRGGPGANYSPRVDQLPFTRQMDLELARRRSPSFRRFERELLRLVEYIRRQGSGATASPARPEP